MKYRTDYVDPETGETKTDWTLNLTRTGYFYNPVKPVGAIEPNVINPDTGTTLVPEGTSLIEALNLWGTYTIWKQNENLSWFEATQNWFPYTISRDGTSVANYESQIFELSHGRIQFNWPSVNLEVQDWMPGLQISWIDQAIEMSTLWDQIWFYIRTEGGIDGGTDIKFNISPDVSKGNYLAQLIMRDPRLPQSAPSGHPIRNYKSLLDSVNGKFTDYVMDLTNGKYVGTGLMAEGRNWGPDTQTASDAGLDWGAFPNHNGYFADNINDTQSYDCVLENVNLGAGAKDYLFVAARLGGLRILDVDGANKNAPVEVGWYHALDARKVTVDTTNKVAYILSFEDHTGFNNPSPVYGNRYWVFAFDISDIANITFLGYYLGELNQATDIITENDGYVYLSVAIGGGQTRLEVLDGTDIANGNLVQLSTLDTYVGVSSFPSEIAKFGHYAYIIDGTGIIAFNVLIPSTPAQGPHYNALNGGTPIGLCIDSNQLYFSTVTPSTSYLEIWDLAVDPGIPSRIGSVDVGLTQLLFGTIAKGNNAYIHYHDGTNTRVKQIDVTTPATPVVGGFVNTAAGSTVLPLSLAINSVEDRVYACTYDKAEIQPVDVSTPATPTVSGMTEYFPDVTDSTAGVVMHRDISLMGPWNWDRRYLDYGQPGIPGDAILHHFEANLHRFWWLNGDCILQQTDLLREQRNPAPFDDPFPIGTGFTTLNLFQLSPIVLDTLYHSGVISDSIITDNNLAGGPGRAHYPPNEYSSFFLESPDGAWIYQDRDLFKPSYNNWIGRPQLSTGSRWLDFPNMSGDNEWVSGFKGGPYNSIWAEFLLKFEGWVMYHWPHMDGTMADFTSFWVRPGGAQAKGHILNWWEYIFNFQDYDRISTSATYGGPRASSEVGNPPTESNLFYREA